MIYEIKYNEQNKINTIKNSCIALFYIDQNQLYLYLVQLKNNLWDIPGGKINRNKKENSFNSALREFKEETGFDLKNLKRKMYFQSITWGNPPHTRIYYYISNSKNKLNFKFQYNNETKDGKWFNVRFLPKLRHIKSILFLINFIERYKLFII